MGSPQNEWGKDISAFMQLALDQVKLKAKLALDNLEVPVGCVIVEEGKVIASGRNRTNETRNATRHAEMEAIDTLLEQWQDQGSSTAEVAEKFLKCSLFVTCEPCVMCAAALSIIGIKEVYFGCANDKFGGCGSILSLHSSGIRPSVSTEASQTAIFLGLLIKLHGSGQIWTVDGFRSTVQPAPSVTSAMDSVQMRALAKSKESLQTGSCAPVGGKVLVEYYDSLTPVDNGKVPEAVAA